MSNNGVFLCSDNQSKLRFHGTHAKSNIYSYLQTLSSYMSVTTVRVLMEVK